MPSHTDVPPPYINYREPTNTEKKKIKYKQICDDILKNIKRK